MTHSPHDNLLLVLDDRERAEDQVRAIVGARRYGEIVFRRRNLADHFREGLPDWARARLVHLRTPEDVAKLRGTLERSSDETAVLLCAGRAGFPDADRLRQLVERVPYADHDFTDRHYKPLVVYLRNAHRLIDWWPRFEAHPVHQWDGPWAGSLRLESVVPMDLGQVREFLSFISGATATRHFNEVAMDAYFFSKSSTDKEKMRAEYAFYGLVPERMRPWLVQPFDYRDDGDRASYRMMRYYLADAALQWVHGAFDADSFAAFVDRLLFFVEQRPARPAGRGEAATLARELF
ncbi:MAG TPA: hypothetical protein VNB23_14605, partial [Ramlibacter sp.]|nr:hypothetical protein [Ramlibacter sp.]